MDHNEGGQTRDGKGTPVNNTLEANFQLRADLAGYIQSTPRSSVGREAAGALHTALRDGLREVVLDIPPWEISEALQQYLERARTLGLAVRLARPTHASPRGDTASPSGSQQGVASQISNNGRQRETARGENVQSCATSQDRNQPQTTRTNDNAPRASRDAFRSDAHRPSGADGEKSQAQDMAQRTAVVEALRVKNRGSRSRTVSTHITAEERAAIEARIRESGLDLSAFVRQAIREKLSRNEGTEAGTLVLHLSGEQFRKICQLVATENRQRDCSGTG